MGTDKAYVEIAGSPMIVLVANALAAAGCDVVVIGRGHAAPGLRAVGDDEGAGSGPAAGLATALRLAAGRPVFLAATDQPMLRPGTVAGLLGIDGGAAVVPVDRGTRQPTCAVYLPECAAPLASLIAREGHPSLQRLLDTVDTRDVGRDEWAAWGEDGRSWWSLDSPSAVDAARAVLDGAADPPAPHSG